MKHQCWWDVKHRCARFKIVGELMPAEAELLMDQLRVLEDRYESQGLIIDHTESPRPLSRETRAVLERRGRERPNDARIAFFGMTNLNRMLAQIIVSILRKSKYTQFFQTEVEAEAWIDVRGGRAQTGT